MDPVRPHLDDLRLPVHGVGDDSRLRPGERDRVEAEVGDRHRDESAGDALADRDEHVQLPRLRLRRDLVGEGDELVRVLAHRRDDGDDAAPAPSSPRRGARRRGGSSRGRRPRCRRTSSRGCPRRRAARPARRRGRARRSSRSWLSVSYIGRRPERALPRVTSSAYSRSPPTGRPLASRVTRTRSRRRSAR